MPYQITIFLFLQLNPIKSLKDGDFFKPFFDETTILADVNI